MTDDQAYRTNVLLEEIKTGVGVISDGHKALTAAVKEINGKIDGLTEDMGMVKVRLGRIEGDVAVLKTDMGDVKGRLDGVDGRLDTMDGRLGRIEHHVGLNGAGPATRSKRKAPAKRR